MRASDGTLSPAAQRVVTFIDQNRAATLAKSASELAATIGTSDATVIRAVQALGFEGLGDLRDALASALDHRATPADDMRRTLADVGADAKQAIDLVLETHSEAVDALQDPEVRGQIHSGVKALHAVSRIFVFGMGPSASIARYVALLLNRNGRAARSLDATGIALADQLLDLGANDGLLILSYGRLYPEAVTTVAEGNRLRLPLVLITDTLNSRLARHANVVIPARRGRSQRVALHGTTLIVLEALVLGLAASDKSRSIEALERLNRLRRDVRGQKVTAG
jgi:DNA-binding MurR/RpiR family transcriptional regulator